MAIGGVAWSYHGESELQHIIHLQLYYKPPVRYQNEPIFTYLVPPPIAFFCVPEVTLSWSWSCPLQLSRRGCGHAADGVGGGESH